jgi:hypothetical protein
MQEIAFLILTFLFLLFFYGGTGKNKIVMFISFLWIISISILSFKGFFEDTNTIPPRLLLILVGNILLMLYLFLIVKNSIIDNRFSLGIHSLRLPVEIILFRLFLEGLVPKIMTFQGWNFDIIIGLTAISLFVLMHVFNVKISIKILILWNIIGILFLFGIVSIAILSAPLSIQQLSFDQPNKAVLLFPYILLPAFIVPIVFLTHILSIKEFIRSEKFNRNNKPQSR